LFSGGWFSVCESEKKTVVMPEGVAKGELVMVGRRVSKGDDLFGICRGCIIRKYEVFQ
jgi:hypothetical protein